MATTGNDTISLTSAVTPQNITADAGDDSVRSGSGNDTIRGGFGADTVFGGAGNDFLYGNDGTESSLDGADALFGEAGNDSILGDSGADVLFGGTGLVDPNDGDDTISGGTGGDAIYGNGGNDLINGDAGNDSIWGGDGTNTIYGDTGTTETSTDGADQIFAGIRSDVVYGGGGNDTIYGGGGINTPQDDADTIYGGSGNDVIYGNGGDDSLVGGDGNDTLYGGLGSNTLSGGAGADVFFVYDEASASAVVANSLAATTHNQTIIQDFDSTDIINIRTFSNGTYQFSQLTLSQVGSDLLITGPSSFLVYIVNASPSSVSASNFTFTNILTGVVTNGNGQSASSETSTVAGGTSGGGSGSGSGGGGGGGGSSVTRVFTVTAGESLIGSNSHDSFEGTAATIQATDVVDGKNGNDTLKITGGGTVDLSGVTLSSVENITVDDGSATTIVIGTHEGNYTGGSSGDTFSIAAGTLSTAYAINGAGGSDTLSLTGGTATLDLSTALALTSVETIAFGSATTVTGATSTDFSFVGSAGNDTFLYAASGLSSADTVNGNGGTDNISTSGTADLTNVSDIDTVTLSAASTVTGGTLNTAITGSGSADTFIYADANFTTADSINGGAGVDIIQLSDAATLNGTDFANKSAIEQITLGGNSTVALADAFVSTATGTNVTVNANGYTTALDTSGLTGANTVTLNGDATAGNELFTLAAANNVNILTTAGYAANVAMTTGNNQITFNSGDDTLTIAEDANLTGSDSIVGGTGSDSLNVGDGSANNLTLALTDGDGSNGGISGFETLDLTGNNAQTITLSVNQTYLTSTASNALTVDLNGLDIDSLTTATGLTGTVTITDSADTDVGITLANGADHSGIVIGDGEISTVVLGNQANTVTGGNANDLFIVADSLLTAADSLTGGAEVSADVLSITGAAGNVDFVATATAVSGFEAITVNADRITGTRTMVISDNLVNSATNDALYLRTSGAGNYYGLDTSNVNSARHVVIDTGAAIALANATNVVYADDSSTTARDVTILGGTGADTVVFTDTSLTSADTFNGGTNTDTLQLSNAATITTGDLTNISNVEVIALAAGTSNTVTFANAFVEAITGDSVELANGTATVTLDTTNLAGGDLGQRVVIGGTGAITLASGSYGVMTKTGVDNNITGSTGSETIFTSNGHLNALDAIAAGSGSDTLVFTDATVIDFSVATNVSGFDTLMFTTNGSDVNLTNAFVDAGGLTIDATSDTVTVALNGADLVAHTKDVTVQNGRYTLGTGEDRVVLGVNFDSIVGGSGNDRFIMDEADNLTSTDTIGGGTHTTGDALIIRTDTNVTLDLTGTTGDVSATTGLEFLALTGVVAAAADVTAAVTVDGASEIDFIVNDGTLALTGTATAGDVTVLSTGIITLTSGDALTLADSSGTVAHTSSAAWTVGGGSSEIASILTAYTGGSVTLGAAGTVVGGTGADSVNANGGTAATTNISLGAGIDTITIDNDSFGNATIIDGGAQSDVIIFSNAVDITGDAATDGNKQNVETLRLGAAGNTIVLAAGEADNISDSGTGALTIETGGTGNTITSLRIADGAVTIDGGLAATMSGGASTFTVNDGSTITLFTGANHNIVGSSVGGQTGVDTWTIAEADVEGTDTLAGGGGSDILSITEGGNNAVTYTDSIFTNFSTIETLRVTGATTTTNITLGTNANTAIGTLTAVSGVKEFFLDLVSANGTNTITATAASLDAANHVVLMDSGDATVSATLGAASEIYIGTGDAGTITGSSGDDYVVGANLGDTFSGNAGNDTLRGGTGNDALTGGANNDRFDFYEFGAANADSVTDMKTDGLDLIRFSDSAFDFDAAIAGVAFTSTDITAVGADFTGNFTSISQNFVYDTTDGQVWYNNGGTGELVLTISNFASYSFSVSDFAAIA